MCRLCVITLEITNLPQKKKTAHINAHSVEWATSTAGTTSNREGKPAILKNVPRSACFQMSGRSVNPWRRRRSSRSSQHTRSTVGAIGGCAVRDSWSPPGLNVIRKWIKIAPTSTLSKHIRCWLQLVDFFRWVFPFGHKKTFDWFFFYWKAC